jgi:DNA-binding CsgD family transcriptional regulator/PAS domain-containing protein
MRRSERDVSIRRIRGFSKMNDTDAHDDLVALIYDAAIDRNRWSSVLERIADATASGGSALIMQDRTTGRGEGIFIRGDPVAYAEYFEEFAAINPLIDASEHLCSGAVTTDRDVLPRYHFVRSDYYRGFLVPNEMSSMLSLTVLRDGDTHCAFNFCRKPGQEEHGEAQRELARRLMPHLQRAFTISLKLQETQGALGASEAVLDRLACGVVLFDARGRVLHANAVARRLAAAGDAFTLGARGIAGLDATLSTAVLRAAQGTEGAALVVPRSSGRTPLSALVSPLREGPVWLMRRPAALLVIGDPDVPTDALEERLRAVYALTSAEALVAAQLMTGASPQDIAARLGIGIATVRQHMSRSFAKTGTTRQAELVQLLLRTLGPTL